MQTAIDHSKYDFVWGRPYEKPNNDGKRISIALLVVLLAGVVAGIVHFHTYPGNANPGEVVLLGVFAVLLNLGALFRAMSTNLRVDGVLANKDGMYVAYSYTPKAGSNYENIKVFISWKDVRSIDDVDCEGGDWVNIKLSRELASGDCGFIMHGTRSETYRNAALLNELRASVL